MIARSSSCLLAACAALTLASCSQEDDGLRVITVAVGAEVTLTLRQSNCDTDLVTACLSELPQGLESVELSSKEPFELGATSVEIGTVQVTVKAVAAGDTVLVVNHTGFRDQVTTDRVRLRAAEITHVVPHVHCDDDDMPEPARYPMTPGTEFAIELTPMADTTPLAYGDLELVTDSAGFVPIEPSFDGLRQYRAPVMPGSYTWDLAGSKGLDFVVYDPADVDVSLTAEDRWVHVGRVLDGAAVCHHQGAARATLEVTKGACMPYVHGYEIDGELPVDLGWGDIRLELSGKDTCEVTARRDGGSAVSVSLPVDNLPQPPAAGGGTTLTATPLSVGGVPEKRDACPIVKNLGDGVCDVVDKDGYIIVDAECLLDWSWVKEPYAIGLYDETPLTKERIGQGLWIELRLGIQYSFAFIPAGIYSPNALEVSPSPATGLDITNEGCIGHDRQVLALRPDAAGKYTLNLDADNVYEPTTFTLSAAAIASWQCNTDAVDVKTFAGGTEAWWFVGSETRYAIKYLDSGGAELAGVAPIHVSSDTAGSDATASGDRIATGTVPADLRVETEATQGAHLFHVVDASAIAGLGGMDAAAFPVGSGQCLEAYATEAAGARIHGKSPVRPRAKIAGTAVVVDAQFPYDNKLCVHGYEPGTTDLSVTWGDYSGQTTYTAYTVQ